MEFLNVEVLFILVFGVLSSLIGLVLVAAAARGLLQTRLLSRTARRFRGSVVEVEPANPGNARVARFTGVWGSTVGMIAGVPFLAIGVVVVAVGVHRPQEQAKENTAARFIAAAGRGDIELLDHGADPNARDREGKTVLDAWDVEEGPDCRRLSCGHRPVRRRTSRCGLGI